MRNALPTAVFYFVILFTATQIWYLFLPVSQSASGIALLFWSVLGLSMTLWVFETLFYRKTARSPKRGENKTLPSRLLQKMDESRTQKSGLLAVKVINGFNGLVLCIIAVYFLWAAIVSFYPETPPPFLKLDQLISDFFKHYSAVIQAPDFMSAGIIQALMMKFSHIALIIIACFIVQAFLYSDRHLKSLLWITLPCFFASFFILSLQLQTALVAAEIPVYGYGIDKSAMLQAMDILPKGDLSSFQKRGIEYGWAGNTFIYGIGVIALINFLRGASKTTETRAALAAAVIILAFMFYADHYKAHSSQIWALWLAGWTSLAIFSVHSTNHYRKVYTLYQ